jgi:hypothetical protein
MLALWRILPVLPLALALGSDDPTKWQDYESKEGKFRCQMPGKVKTESRSQLGITLHAHAVDMKNSAYMIGYADLPGAVNAFDYTACVNAMVNTWRGKVLYQKNVKVEGSDGVEFEAKITSPADGWAAGRVFVKDGRMYQLLILGAKIRAESKDVQQFWNSFKLLPK